MKGSLIGLVSKLRRGGSPRSGSDIESCGGILFSWREGGREAVERRSAHITSFSDKLLHAKKGQKERKNERQGGREGGR